MILHHENLQKEFIKIRNLFVQGQYSQYQCGVKISDARAEDSGEWSCDLEEYNRGATRNYGAKVKK